MIKNSPILTDKLQDAANRHKVLVMSFIAPDTIVRTSPVSNDYAKIKIQDLYKIEEVIEELKEKGNLPKKLHLIIHTPGGGVSATTKIARYLQESFEEIEAYVPYQAASGGTVLCLTAKCIVMSSTSNLTPIDPQIPYKGTRVSVVSYEQVINDMKNKYSTSSPDEIPSPDQQMCNQLDPIIAKEFSKMAMDCLMVALELLDMSQNPQTPQEREKILKAAISLAKTDWPHSHQINAKSASSMGLTISSDADKMDLLRVYKEWVSTKLNERETNHIIETYVPKQEGDQNETEKSVSNQEEQPEQTATTITSPRRTRRHQESV